MQTLIPSLLAASVAACTINGKAVPCSEIFGSPFFLPLIFLVLIIAIIEIVSMWKIFEKAGKPGWAAIIPIYNIVVLYQIVGINPWLILTLLIPFVGPIISIVFKVIVSYQLALRFGRSTGFVVGLFFLSFIFYPILAFSNDVYRIPETGATAYTPPTPPVGPTTPIPPPSTPTPGM